MKNLEERIKKYPFLKEIIGENVPETFKECRLDLDFLCSKPKHTLGYGGGMHVEQKENVHFVLKDGTVLCDAVVPCIDETNAFCDVDDFFQEGETVANAITRMTKEKQNETYPLSFSEKIAYIVRTVTGHDIENHYSVGGFHVDVIKVEA